MLCRLVRQRDAKALLNHEYSCIEELSVMTTEEMVAAAKAVVPSVTVQEVQAKLQAGERVVILDVREKEEYDQGHISQATLLPRGLLEFRYRDVWWVVLLPGVQRNFLWRENPFHQPKYGILRVGVHCTTLNLSSLRGWTMDTLLLLSYSAHPQCSHQSLGWNTADKHVFQGLTATLSSNPTGDHFSTCPTTKGIVQKNSLLSTPACPGKMSPRNGQFV
jgi:hypothetical protein